MLREFLAPDVEGVESIGAVGAMLEEVLLRLWILFRRLVLSEPVAATFDAGRLNGQY
jgi:hypothetical protein